MQCAAEVVDPVAIFDSLLRIFELDCMHPALIELLIQLIASMDEHSAGRTRQHHWMLLCMERLFKCYGDFQH